MTKRPIDRRTFVVGSVGLGAAAACSAFPARMPTIVDTHMHVWADNAKRYPFPHPYVADFEGPPHEATVEMLIKDMDQNGCSHAVLVQVIYHGWDNAYVADCVRRYPQRLKAHGLIDPTDTAAADKLEYWIKEQGLHGMRFSPIYYRDGMLGGDAWLTASHMHRVWRKAAELGAVFNFFISPPQLEKLAEMKRRYPQVKVIIDHLSQMDLGAEDPEPHFKQLLKMAQLENVWVKVSELSSVSKSKQYPFPDAYPYVKRVYEAFGPDRLLFGTGYPGSARAHYNRPSLREEIDLISKMPFFSAEDRQKLLGRNAAKLWGFA